MDMITQQRIESLKLAIEIVKLKAQNNQFGRTEDVYAEAEKVFNCATWGFKAQEQERTLKQARNVQTNRTPCCNTVVCTCHAVCPRCKK